MSPLALVPPPLAFNLLDDRAEWPEIVLVMPRTADGWLEKPFDLDAVVEAVARHLRPGPPP